MFKLPKFSIEEFITPFLNSDKPLSHDEVVKAFLIKIEKMEDEEFIDLLICNGFIPDYYGHDSTEETLYSKMIEVIVADLNCALLSTHIFQQFKVYHAACSARSTIWND